MYHVIYDGNCNLCTNLVKLLEQWDQGQQFNYLPMQDQAGLEQFGITPADCELGMILINAEFPAERWQGSNAAEKIAELLPAGTPLIEAYRALPGVKWLGDQLYAQIRDHRYALFGKRDQTYESAYPFCDSGNCGSSTS
jgi:predicted DCC family thiol-disulfide oxidoreductase YuxK